MRSDIQINNEKGLAKYCVLQSYEGINQQLLIIYQDLYRNASLHITEYTFEFENCISRN